MKLPPFLRPLTVSEEVARSAKVLERTLIQLSLQAIAIKHQQAEIREKLDYFARLQKLSGESK